MEANDIRREDTMKLDAISLTIKRAAKAAGARNEIAYVHPAPDGPRITFEQPSRISYYEVSSSGAVEFRPYEPWNLYA